MRQALGRVPMFDAVVEHARRQVEEAMEGPIDVPVPRDAAGYTHERHKQNYVEMQLAGVLYQLTGDLRYARFVREVLRGYAGLYPKLGNHPAGKSASPGRLFHQTLNETVWLVNASQAYDSVYDSLAPEDRALFEARIFRPMARFFTEERTREFDRVHNHGTWMDVSVGMIGYAMGDQELVKKALYGSRKDGSAGFLRQLDELFSPDGYYSEGPYYARYALTPFLLFAEAIDRNQPDLDIHGRRDRILSKALYALLQQTDGTGAFLPFNDALKEKSDVAPEVVSAVDLVYARYGRDARLLSIARRQGTVALSPAGLEAARALQADSNPPPFPYASVEYRDGPQGESGGLGILRSGPGAADSIAVLKATAFGMEHGHYDKLSMMYYDDRREQLADYGAVRFLNVEQKNGGRYLLENKTYAKQSIAHNTVVVDGRTQYGADPRIAEDRHSVRHFFSAADPGFQVMSARDDTAVPGVRMQRTVAMVRDRRLAHLVVVDVFRLVSDRPRQYDYALHYRGALLSTTADYTPHADQQRPLGSDFGYQHLWVEAEGTASSPFAFTWINGRRYYTVTAAADPGAKVFFARVGAHDPHFNLRREPAVILRQSSSAHVFASVIEPHGDWDPTREFTAGGASSIRDVQVLAATEEGTAVRISGERGLSWTLLVTNRASGFESTHRLEAGSETFAWRGAAVLLGTDRGVSAP